VLGHAAIDLQAHRVAKMSLPYDFLHGGQKVGRFVFFDLEICIPGYPEGIGGDDLKDW
jgi:hypothetical protein